MEATFQTKLPDNEYLDKYAAYFSGLARKLFVDLFIRKKPQNKLKKAYIKNYGLTARQFNSLVYAIKGIAQSYTELLKLGITELKAKIALLEKWLAKQEAKLAKLKNRPEPKAVKKRRKLRFKVHQKKRRLRNLRHQLDKLTKTAADKKIRICFGSRKLFAKQFHLQENSYFFHNDWLNDWRETRDSQFFVVGSCDETSGNQTRHIFRITLSG